MCIAKHQTPLYWPSILASWRNLIDTAETEKGQKNYVLQELDKVKEMSSSIVTSGGILALASTRDFL